MVPLPVGRTIVVPEIIRIHCGGVTVGTEVMSLGIGVRDPELQALVHPMLGANLERIILRIGVIQPRDQPAKTRVRRKRGGHIATRVTGKTGF